MVHTVLCTMPGLRPICIVRYGGLGLTKHGTKCHYPLSLLDLYFQQDPGVLNITLRSLVVELTSIVARGSQHNINGYIFGTDNPPMY